MNKIIRITKEPSFNIGVKSYVVRISYIYNWVSAYLPDIDSALIFTDKETLDKAMEMVKKDLPKATVEAIDVQN